MRIIDLMTKDPFCVTTQDTVSSSLELMCDKDIRHLPVIEEGSLVGIISDKDVNEYYNSNQASFFESDKPIEAKVSEIMSTGLISISQGSEVSDLIELMVDNKIAAVPVVDSIDNKVVGIVSYIDILKNFKNLN